MQKLNQYLFVILFPMVAMLSGCASLHEDLPPSLIQLSYTATNKEATGLIRGFDNGTATILQFIDLDKSKPKITEANGKLIAYRKMGQYAILPRLYSKLYVKANGEISTVTRLQQPVSPTQETTQRSVLPPKYENAGTDN
jgi:hypothetical protein